MDLGTAVDRLQSALMPIAEGLPAGGERRHAAVLVLLFEREGEAYFPLTVRPDTMSRHPGQVSLPGGAHEAADGSLWETALRETREELGVRTESVRPLGRLQRVPVTVSNYDITPFVGWTENLGEVQPDGREVAEVIEAPLDTLLDAAVMREEQWELRGKLWYVGFYHIGEARVWGATARVLGDLARRLDPLRSLPHEPGSVRPVDE